MSAYHMITFKLEQETKCFIKFSPLKSCTAAGCHSSVAVSAQTVAFRMQRLQIPKKTVKSSFLKFKVNVQRRNNGSLLRDHVTALPKSRQKSWKSPCSRYYGAYGLQQ